MKLDNTINERRLLVITCAIGLLAGLIVGEPQQVFGKDSKASKLDAPGPGSASRKAETETRWCDVSDLTIEGKGWTDTSKFFHRFPAKAKGRVRNPVWGLSTNTAGLCVRFVTDASNMTIRWELTGKRLAMDHFAATGVSGIDLYVNDHGRWRWVTVGRPGQFPTNSCSINGIPEGQHEYMLYLPLYNGIESMKIGIPAHATLSPTPPRPPGRDKPICFYGTSITQGGCASRPGMAYSAILGRRLGYPVINLGFSGNGRMEPEVAELLAELDVAAYVLDALPNMKPEMITERVEPFVAILRRAHPDVPVVLVENIPYQNGAFLPMRRQAYLNKNRALRDAYDRLVAQGVSHLHYVPSDNLYGHDGEATVDGTHATDLGFLRFADALEPFLRQVLDAR